MSLSSTAAVPSCCKRPDSPPTPSPRASRLISRARPVTACPSRSILTDFSLHHSLTCQVPHHVSPLYIEGDHRLRRRPSAPGLSRRVQPPARPVLEGGGRGGRRIS